MKTKFYAAIIIALTITCNSLQAQNIFPSTGAAGIGTTTPDASSLLEIKSTTKGLLIPRMTQAQRNAITSPATGLMIYQTNATPGFYYYGGGGWKSVAAKAWDLTGNAGTNPSTNFIGTTDAQSLVFKVNNLRAGLIDYSTCCSGTRNTAFGQIALNSNTSGADNTATGYGSLYTNTTGNQNVGYGKYALFNNNANNNSAYGFNAMFFNTTGANNTATGSLALQNNTTSSNNTANGYQALYSNNGGNYNTGMGVYSLYSNNSGGNNTATGGYALYSNTTGSDNTAHGYGALELNSTGNFNTATGFDALYANTGSFNTATGDLTLTNNTTGTYNTATGVNALGKNTTGSQNTAYGNNTLYTIVGGSDNTAIGYNAMYGDNTGGGIQKSTAIGSYAMFNATTGFIGSDDPGASLNTAIGFSALYSGGNVQSNTAIGDYALYSNVTNWYNTAVGTLALYNNTGGNNTAVGEEADVSSNYFNSTAIGVSAYATANNQARIGSVGWSTDPTSIGGEVGWTTLSDGRVKKNIKQNVPGLAFINKLHPITYNLDLNAADKIIQRPVIKDKDGKIVGMQEDFDARKAKEEILYTGFIAQDVEKVAKSLNYDFSGVDAAKNDKDLYGLRYSDFVVPLVKAVQELSVQNDSLKNENAVQQKINGDLQNQINELKAMMVSNQSTVNGQQSTVLSSASLQQNIPNPFTHTTSISYTLPQKFANAQIVITDKNGKTLKTVTISGSGKGNLNVDASTLSSGAYQYSLIVDGRLIATKQMVLAR